MLAVLHVLALASSGKEATPDACMSTPELMTNPAPFVAEYLHFADNIGRSVQPVVASSNRHRRSVDFTRYSPVINIVVEHDHITPSQLHIIGIAYKFFIMVYKADDDVLETVTIRGRDDNPDKNVLGVAEPYINRITMYVDVIPGPDVFLIVLLHEFMHLFGFSTQASPGATSFYDRSDPMTLLYNSPTIRDCLATRYGGPTNQLPSVDPARVHWNNSNHPVRHDLMLPYISFKETATSICTIQAVLESRPGWTSKLCDTDADCAVGVTSCRPVGTHWISTCQNPRPDVHLRSAVSPGTQFVIFGIVVVLQFAGVSECRHRRQSGVPFVKTAVPIQRMTHSDLLDGVL